jgi:signal peptidase I
MPVPGPSTIPPLYVAEHQRSGFVARQPALADSSDAVAVPAAHNSTVRQILDSLISLAIAVIVFRAFVLEGYIISTGSMAPCLLGYHKRIECPDCHYRFQFGVAFDQPVPAAEVASCPNCGQQSIDVSEVPRNSGDQLLVFKAAFPLRAPKRWEIVVFQNPTNPAQAYVKRLIGLPGESVQIQDGDVFINGVRQSKPLDTQRSMRIPVFDQEFHADSSDWVPRWIANGNWQSHSSHFTSPESDTVEWVNYYHWPRLTASELEAQPTGTPQLRPSILTDTYGYNRPGSGGVPVQIHDLMLTATLKFSSEDSQFVAVIPHRGRLAICRIDARQPRVDVWVTAARMSALNEALAGSLAPSASKLLSRDWFESPLPFEFSTFDHQVSIGLRNDSVMDVSMDEISEPIARSEKQPELLHQRARHSAAYPEATIGGRFEDQSKAPVGETTISTVAGSTESDSADLEAIRIPARFGARGGAIEISELRLYRDVHYTTEDYSHATDESLEIGDDEYFFLGDNSPVSLDSRAWDSPFVPGHLIIGRPLFVHLPSRPGRLRIGDRERYFRLPDFSRMRWIR